MAAIMHEKDYGKTEQWWSSSPEPTATLYRAILDMDLPYLVRTQVRRENQSSSVRGACFGASRTPRSADKTPSRLAFKTKLNKGNDQLVQSALLMIVSSIAKAAPGFRFSSVQINQGPRAAMHMDTANVGPSLFCELGPFVGGGLWECGAASVGAPKFLVGDSWQSSDGRRPHVTAPFHGERVSIIAFTSDAAADLQTDAGLAHATEARRLGFPLPSISEINSIPREVHDLAEGQRQYGLMAEMARELAGSSVGDVAASADYISSQAPADATATAIQRSCRLLPRPIATTFVTVATILCSPAEGSALGQPQPASPPSQPWPRHGRRPSHFAAPFVAPCGILRRTNG